MSGLKRTLGATQYLTIAIGCMIGIGWITVVGEWLSRAGPAWAVAGFLAGGLVMAGVAACYAELTGMMPVSGGDVVFAERVFGREAAFFVGWFLVLMAVSVAAFEALSFVWVAGTLAPWLGADRLYTVLGEPVTLQQILLGVGVLGFMLMVNRVGVNASARAQDILTVFKLVVMVAFIAVGLAFGDPGRLLQGPLEAGPHAGLRGALWIVATCAFWLGGFQVISQAAGERDQGTSLRAIGWITTGSVLVGVLFYAGVVAVVSAAAPLRATVSAPLPAAAAAQAVFHSRWGAAAVLLAGMSGILATLNAMLLSGSRLLLALAGFGFVPAILGRVDRRGTPGFALTAVTGFALCGVFAGKGLLLPVVDTASMSLILSYLLVCAAALRLRASAPDTARPFRVPGGAATIAATAAAVAAMAGFIVIEPALGHKDFPIQWALFLAWALAGGAMRLLGRRATEGKTS